MSLKQQNTEIFVLEINMDANSEIAKHYDITSIPTFIFYKNNMLINMLVLYPLNDLIPSYMTKSHFIFFIYDNMS